MIDLREARIAKGYTQEQLADEVGCARTTISGIECERIRPSVEMAQIIARILEFEWTRFFVA